MRSGTECMCLERGAPSCTSGRCSTRRAYGSGSTGTTPSGGNTTEPKWASDTSPRGNPDIRFWLLAHKTSPPHDLFFLLPVFLRPALSSDRRK